jgi:hypothetical protein
MMVQAVSSRLRERIALRAAGAPSTIQSSLIGLGASFTSSAAVDE